MSSAARMTFCTTRRGGLVCLGLLTLSFFGDLLFESGDRVISGRGTDIFRQFAGWRSFGFDEIAKGNFPFWNPYVYGGMPYFSGFQSALLYPPNWLYIALPLEKAINWGVALHVWWIGAGMFLWLRSTGLRQLGAIFGSVLLMFCAPHFLHIFAGHLTNLCVMAWMPWLFLAISGWRAGQSIGWLLLGALAVAMQILAGHPQYVFYGGIVAGLYALLVCFEAGEARWRFLLGCAGMYAGAALLSAVQLLPGLEAAGESIRGGGTGKAFAGSYSFPPENLLTLLAPDFFGNQVKVPYWGRWFFWEMAAFCGAIGFGCAVAAGMKETRARLCWIGGGATIFLALGSYTPLFDLMYAAVPGFDMFRGTSKFIFFAAIFVTALAALGIDRLERNLSLPNEGLILACIGTLALLGVALAGWVGSGEWGGFREWIWETKEVTHLSPEEYFGMDLEAAARKTATRSLCLGAGAMAITVLGISLRRRYPRVLYVLAGLGLLEVITFAAGFRESFAFSECRPDFQIEFRRANPGDYRVVDQAQTNAGMLSKLPDLWGDDPGVLRRYAEFMAITQGVDPREAIQHLAIQRTHARWDLLRFRHVIAMTINGVGHQEIKGAALRRFELVPGCRVIAEPGQLLDALFQEGFDPLSTALLEKAPEPSLPEAGVAVKGSWKIEKESTDDVSVSVSADRPCLLLMSDPYSSGWRARSMIKTAPQASYEVLPANHVLRGIPLAAGDHVIKIYFRPRSFGAGASISALAWVGWGFCLVRSRRRRNRKSL